MILRGLILSDNKEDAALLSMLSTELSKLKEKIEYYHSLSKCVDNILEKFNAPDSGPVTVEYTKDMCNFINSHAEYLSNLSEDVQSLPKPIKLMQPQVRDRKEQLTNMQHSIETKLEKVTIEFKSTATRLNSSLEVMVSEHLANGWELYGPPTGPDMAGFYIQAMTRPKQAEPEQNA